MKKYCSYVKYCLQAAVIVAACIGISGCSIIKIMEDIDKAYFREKKEYPYLEHTVVVACQVSELFEGVPFQLTYDLLNNDPESRTVIGGRVVNVAENVNGEWCRTGIRPHVIVPENNTIRYYQHFGRRPSITDGNQDPARGATKSWDLAGIRVDPETSEAYFSFRADIIDGEILPLGSSFSILHDWDDYRPELMETESLKVNGLEWTRRAWRSVGAGIRIPPDSVRSLLEVYQAKVGNFSILVYATFPRQVLSNPDWLSHRRALLRQWVHSFSVGPVTKPGLLRVPSAQSEASGGWFLPKGQSKPKAAPEPKPIVAPFRYY